MWEVLASLFLQDPSAQVFGGFPVLGDPLDPCSLDQPPLVRGADQVLRGSSCPARRRAAAAAPPALRELLDRRAALAMTKGKDEAASLVAVLQNAGESSEARCQACEAVHQLTKSDVT